MKTKDHKKKKQNHNAVQRANKKSVIKNSIKKIKNKAKNKNKRKINKMKL